MLRALCLILCLGGTSLGAGEPSPDNEALGFASPHGARDAYRQGLHEKRWGDAFQYLTPDSKEHFIGGILFAAAYLQKTVQKDSAAKIKTLLKRHDLDVERIESEANEANEERIKELIRRVENKRGLFHEAAQILDRAQRPPT